MKRIFTLLLALICILCLTVFSFAKSELSDLLLENFDPTMYTEESYRNYQKALDKAISVQENMEATADDVNVAKEELIAAKNGLVLILDRDTLLSYIETIDEFLNSTTYRISDAMEQKLVEAKSEFFTLYESESLTKEQIEEATNKFSSLKKEAEDLEEVKKFEAEEAPDDVVVPKKVISSTQGLGKVTEIRLTIVGVAAGVLVLGLIAFILYLKPPKFLK